MYCSMRSSSRCWVFSRVIILLVVEGKLEVEALVVGIRSLEGEAFEERGTG